MLYSNAFSDMIRKLTVISIIIRQNCFEIFVISESVQNICNRHLGVFEEIGDKVNQSSFDQELCKESGHCFDHDISRHALSRFLTEQKQQSSKWKICFNQDTKINDTQTGPTGTFGCSWDHHNRFLLSKCDPVFIIIPNRQYANYVDFLKKIQHNKIFNLDRYFLIWI